MILTGDLDKPTLGAVLKTALDAVVVMRLDGTIAGWNDVAARTFGWSFEEANGQRMSEMIIPHHLRAAHERGLKHYLATGKGPVLDRHIEITALHRVGHEIPVELSITRTDQFGEPVFLGFLRDITERREAARRQDLLVGELNHRIKNLLAVVSGVAHQTIRSSSSLADFSTAFSGRLESMGRAYELLTAGVWEHASLQSLAATLPETFGAPDGRVTIDGPDIMLAPRHFLSVSMILHELLTNAMKYGALSAPDGHVALRWWKEDDALALHWAEGGERTIAPPTHKGFGAE